MAILDGELRRSESQFVRVFRPRGKEQLALGRLLVDPNEPTAGISLEPNRNLGDGEYLLSSMSGARQWPVILTRANGGRSLEVHRVPPVRSGIR